MKIGHTHFLMKEHHSSSHTDYRHLLGIEGMERDILEVILERALHLALKGDEDSQLLSGKTLVNLFFETSTRTRTSFELAAKRLGATVLNLQLKDSAIKKGESLLDTAATLDAMGPDIAVVRHSYSGATQLLAHKMSCAVINAGDGRHEHPTQALLDACTIRQYKGSLKNLRVAICGDVKHSRVARSNIHLLQKMGAQIHIVAPPTLIPDGLEQWNLCVFHDMKKGIKDCDIVMMLRLQRERIEKGSIPSRREYFRFYGLTQENFSLAAKDALIMHPGPLNRGLEIDGNLADDINHSVISLQVKNGVAVRIACLEWLMGALD